MRVTDKKSLFLQLSIFHGMARPESHSPFHSHNSLPTSLPQNGGEKKMPSLMLSRQKEIFLNGSVPLNMKHHQLRLNSFLCDNTWVYSKVEEIRIVLIKLFSSDFAYSYWQGTEIIASNPQACLSATQSSFNGKNRGNRPVPCLFCSVPFLLCSINLTSLLLCAASFV